MGVALTSTGPGAANAIGGLFEAAFASSPVLMITGQVETTYLGKGRGFLHEAEHQIDMLRAVVRRAETVRRRVDVTDVLAEVISDIHRGRPQPGAIEIPVDLQSAMAEEQPAPTIRTTRAEPSASAIKLASDLLRDGARPLVWAGGGVNTAGAASLLTALAERLGAPVLTSIEGRGSIPEDHELSLGAHSDLAVMDPVIAAADVVLAVGTRFEANTPLHQSLTIPGKLIHLDADAGVIAKMHPTAIALVGDAGIGLERILDQVPEREPSAERLRYLQLAQQARKAADAETREAMGRDFARMMDTMLAVLPRDAVVVKDATVAAFIWANRALGVFEQRTAIRPASMAIGPGLGLALGAAVGTRRTTVVLHGDGGLMLSIGELAAVVDQQVPLVVCVLNDRGYGVLRYIQDLGFGGRRVGVDLATPDFAAVATATGMRSAKVGDPAQFDTIFPEAVNAKVPFLIDIDIRGFAPMSIRSQPTPVR